MTTAVLIIGLGLILLAAELFTNGIEWLGRKMKLCEGAVGSIFAAVGTALPETMIPVIAIIFGGEAGHEIGIGAILGAPFMLGTLALFITGLAVLGFRKRRASGVRMTVDYTVLMRDLGFFLLVYALAIGAAFLPREIRVIVAVFLILAYVVYACKTIKGGGKDTNKGCVLEPLYFARRVPDPGITIILIQVFVALGLIIGGANLFVDGITEMATFFGVPAFILSLIIAPIATELPEKFNSVIWIGKGKDTLALGNITGAMVFQSSIIPSLGILMTSWDLTPSALISALLTLIASGLIFAQVKLRKYVSPFTLLTGGVMYLVFVACVLTGTIR